jgi:CRISPR-associated endonuclease/helicase Cas3
LKARFYDEAVQKWLRDALDTKPPEAILSPPPCVTKAPARNATEAALWVRFLFSALVDADSLQTEAWEAGKSRPAIPHPISELSERLDSFLDAKFRGGDDTAMNRLRRHVLACCRTQAPLSPGQFTLTVPTGGGKTYSALSFALNHARAFHHRRVITVLPFTTVLEQNVNAYRDALGADAVVEHHSNIDVERESVQNRRATENWDAPMVVTTSVQFLESLYAASKRRCRKLHNIAESVVILDEVQTFPLGLIEPIRSVLKLLADQYGVTVVHCSATQPHLAHGSGAREIIDNPASLFEAVKNRVSVTWPRIADGGEPNKWDIQTLHRSVAHENDSTLVIVHRRKEAEELARLWGDDVIHLSARMCGAHRLDIVNSVKEKLKHERVRLVATQLVEAGVDIDFPVVYRAAAGLDTLAQAAGRCNREGTQALPGKFIVFWAESDPPAESLTKSLAETLPFLRSNPHLDLNDPNLFREFFKSLKKHFNDPLGGQVLQAERDWNFPRSAELFNMIQEAGKPVIAPYGEQWRDKLRMLRTFGPSRERLRALQRHLVNLYPQEITNLQQRGAIEQAHADLEHLWAVIPGFERQTYSSRFGFAWAAEQSEPAFLIA